MSYNVIKFENINARIATLLVALKASNNGAMFDISSTEKTLINIDMQNFLSDLKKTLPKPDCKLSQEYSLEIESQLSELITLFSDLNSNARKSAA